MGPRPYLSSDVWETGHSNCAHINKHGPTITVRKTWACLTDHLLIRMTIKEVMLFISDCHSLALRTYLNSKPALLRHTSCDWLHCHFRQGCLGSSLTSFSALRSPCCSLYDRPRGLRLEGTTVGPSVLLHFSLRSHRLVALRVRSHIGLKWFALYSTLIVCHESTT